ncbi:MAG: CAP domain-containing protein [Acidimicrobiia bacterium]
MRAARRSVVLATVTAMFVAIMAIPAVAGSAGQFLSKINASRSAAGLAPLEGYWDLADDARAHSNLMADRGELFHSSNLGSVTTGWERLGENVGVGLDVASLHDAFMASSGHRKNILGDYNYAGVGVTVDDEGFMWVTVIFMKAAPGLNDPEETTTTTAPPATTTTTTTTTAPPATTTTTAPPATTTTTAPPATTTTTTQPPTTTTVYRSADGVPGEDAMAAQLELIARYPRFGNPSPVALID